MSIRVNETRRNPTTGKLERTGRQLRPVYSRRSGGGYEVKDSPADEPIPKDSLSADKSLARAQADKAAIDQAAAEKERQKAELKEKQDLRTAQTVTRQLNESAARTGSSNRYGITGDAEGNVFITKSSSETYDQPRDTGANSPRNRSNSAAGQVSPTQGEERTGKDSTGIPGSGSDSGVRSSSPNILTGYERRLTDLQAREARAAERAEKQDNFFRKIPLLGGDNFAQRTGRVILGTPLNVAQGGFLLPQRGYALAEGLIRPETRQQTQGLAVEALKETPAEALRQNNPTTPEGLVNVGLAALGIRGAKPRAPKVEVTRTRTGTIEADLPGGKSFDLTEGTYNVKAGKREFVAETSTGATTKPDAQNTFIRTERTQITIKEVGKRSEYTGVARADLQVKATPTGSKARGTQTQVTNVSKRRAIQETGRTSSKTRNINDDVSITTSATESSKPQTIKPVKDPELVQYPAKVAKASSAEVAQAKSRKLIETQAPLYPKIAEAAGIEVRATTQPVRQTLSESRGIAVRSERVLKAAQGPVKTQKGITVRTTESGKAVVNIGPSAKVAPAATRRIATPTPAAAATVTESVLQVPKANSTPRTQSQVKAAVGRIVAAETKAVPVAVPTPRLKTAQTRTEGRTQTQSNAKQESLVKAARPVTRQESAQLTGQKFRTESKTEQAQAFRPATRVRENVRQRAELIPRAAQAQEQRQEQVVIPALEQVTQQRTRQTQITRAQVPQTAREGLKLAPIVPFKRSDSSEGGFAVFVRRGGKFAQVNTQPLTRGAALKLGADTARNTAARSFKIQRVAGRATGQASGTRLDDFYSSKKERGVFIQKSKTSIKTPGEFREISAKGIRASRGRR